MKKAMRRVKKLHQQINPMERARALGALSEARRSPAFTLAAFLKTMHPEMSGEEIKELVRGMTK
jgi:hypothetical protein